MAYFSQADSFFQPTFSPGDDAFAFWRMAKGHPQILIKPLANDAALTPVVFDLPSGLMNWFHWLDEYRIVVSQTIIPDDAPALSGEQQSRRKRKGADGVTGLSRVFYLADRRTGTLVTFLSFPLNLRFANESDDFLHRLPDEPDRFLVAFPPGGGDYPGVYKVDVKTGEAETVAAPEEPLQAWSVDQEANIRLATGWGEDGFQIRIRAKSGDDWTDLSSHPLFKSGRFGVLGFTEDGSDLYLRSSLGKGRSAIYRFNLQTGSIREKLFEHPRYDAGTLLLAAGGRKVLGATYMDDQPRLEIFDEGFRTQHEAIARHLDSENFFIADISLSGEKWLIATFDATHPGSLYLYEPEADKMALLMSGLAGEEPTPAPVEAVTYFSRDGMEIPAYLTLPATREAGQRIPVILMPHGGPWVRDTLIFDAWSQYFASIGYGVLRPNFRGSSGYGDSFEARGYGQWGQAMQDDISDGADWLVRQGIADRGRMCIVGASYGGYAALMAATRDEDLFKCAIAVAPVTDIPLWIETISSSKAEAKAMLWRTVGAEKLKQARTQSPVHLVKRVRLPILLAHGTNDIRVPPVHSRRMAEVLEKRKRDFSLLWLEGGSHFLLQAEHRRRFLQAATAFLQEHIGRP